MPGYILAGRFGTLAGKAGRFGTLAGKAGSFGILAGKPSASAPRW